MVKPIIAVAPMMDWTDKHCRYFLRLLSKRVWLYSEMVVTGAILHGDGRRFLSFNDTEHPIALQLGGSVPYELAQCAKLGERYGYDEINFNVGCPSVKASCGRFGARLMALPGVVSDGIKAMQDAVSVPVTVKTRLGIDADDGGRQLFDLVDSMTRVGCRTIIVHARRAWLQGLSPRENRNTPPLQYDRVYRLKKNFPQLTIIINGGIVCHEAIFQHLHYVDGVMIGRLACQHPYFLADVDQLFFGDQQKVITRQQILNKFYPYVERQLTLGVPLWRLIRPIMGLFYGVQAARVWRRYLSDHMYHRRAGIEILQQAVNSMALVAECQSTSGSFAKSDRLGSNLTCNPHLP